MAGVSRQRMLGLDELVGSGPDLDATWNFRARAARQHTFNLKYAPPDWSVPASRGLVSWRFRSAYSRHPRHHVHTDDSTWGDPARGPWVEEADWRKSKAPDGVGGALAFIGRETATPAPPFTIDTMTAGAGWRLVRPGDRAT
jgi:hypothetical protein